MSVEPVLPHNHGENINVVLQDLPKNADFSAVSTLFSSLADANRIKLFWFLCHMEECVINLSALMQMSSPALSHHLKILREKGLITSRRAGKEMYYKAANTEEVRLLHHMIELLIDITCPERNRGRKRNHDLYGCKKKEGSLWHQIGAFCLPYLCSCFLQTLYGMADLFIIGQFEGVNGSITAVSIGSQVMHMVTVMIVGLAMGTTVHIGRSIGAARRDLAARFTGNTITLFLGGSLVLAALLLGLVDPVVEWMATPPEAVSGARDYLTICYLGIPFITAYNIISSIFRGMGNSRTPMYFRGHRLCGQHHPGLPVHGSVPYGASQGRPWGRS